MAEPDPQCASAVMMIRPECFGFDSETADSNAFQRRVTWLTDEEAAARGRAEIDGFAACLDAAGVRVVLQDDSPEPAKPDACFPNNWFSTHSDGTVVLYPMASANRRAEVRRELIAELEEREGFRVERVIDLTPLATKELHLEGTGSLVLDRTARVAYACLSQRTSPEALREFGERMGYRTLCFRAADGAGNPIYHTNVMLSLGERFAVVCTESVLEDHAFRDLLAHLELSERVLVDITRAQLGDFCANVLELRTRVGQPVIAMSARALKGFTFEQRKQLEGCGELVSAPLDTVEALGGGSARCALAELFLPSSRP